MKNRLIMAKFENLKNRKMNFVKMMSRGALVLGLILGTQAFKGDKDALHKKIFITQVTEFRDGKPGTKKPIEDEIEFKDGKMFSNFINEKMEFTWMKYDLKKDSTYMDEDVEKKYFEVEISSTNKLDETVYVSIKIDNYEMEGSIKLTKNDKPKKYFEFTGKEKPGKVKKN
jgi:hypothetical protein